MPFEIFALPAVLAFVAGLYQGLKAKPATTNNTIDVNN